MGDCANVYCVDEEKKGVYLYAHWSGSKLPLTVQNALKREQRWDDGQYLNRIIFCEMIKGYEDGECGFGISATMGDNSHSIIVVDAEKKQVGFANPDKEPECYVTWTFEEYIKLSEEDIFKEYTA